MSNLVSHAERELKLAGMFDKDSDYGGALGKAVLRTVKSFSKEHFSGMSAGICIQLLEKLLRFENLTPITDDPKDWIDRTEESGCPIWQSKRNSELFSTDGGKTYYSIGDEKRKIINSKTL